MPNHRIIHTILTIGIAASWQAASMNVRACERCVVYLNPPACQDCVPAILPDDARTIDVQLAWTLEQNRPCVCRAVANLTLDLLASRPSISGQEYFGVLQRTTCGQRITAGLGPIAAGRNFHPYLSKDQVVLLKSAVAISSMDPDLAADRRVIAKAAYLAGEIICGKFLPKIRISKIWSAFPFSHCREASSPIRECLQVNRRTNSPA